MNNQLVNWVDDWFNRGQRPLVNIFSEVAKADDLAAVHIQLREAAAKISQPAYPPVLTSRTMQAFAKVATDAISIPIRQAATKLIAENAFSLASVEESAKTIANHWPKFSKRLLESQGFAPNNWTHSVQERKDIVEIAHQLLNHDGATPQQRLAIVTSLAITAQITKMDLEAEGNAESLEAIQAALDIAFEQAKKTKDASVLIALGTQGGGVQNQEVRRHSLELGLGYEQSPAKKYYALREILSKPALHGPTVYVRAVEEINNVGSLEKQAADELEKKVRKGFTLPEWRDFDREDLEIIGLAADRLAIKHKLRTQTAAPQPQALAS